MQIARIYIIDLAGQAPHILSATAVREYRQAELFLAGAPGLIYDYPSEGFRAVGTAWPRDGATGVPWEPSLAYALGALAALDLTDIPVHLRRGEAVALDDVVRVVAAITLSAADASPVAA